jgi:succinate dehydrogenase/fumarate reductase flavoprotein subunit
VTSVDNNSYDLLVLGSGAAGLSVVLRALELNPKTRERRAEVA